MKVQFSVCLPRLLNSSLHIPADQVLALLSRDEEYLDGFKTEIKKRMDKELSQFNELQQAITCLQISPIRREDDGAAIYSRDGSTTQIPFTHDQHRQNSGILSVLFGALDKIEAAGDSLLTMTKPVTVELTPKQVKYLQVRVARLCKEFTTTGQHIVDFDEKWIQYKADANDEMKAGSTKGPAKQQ